MYKVTILYGFLETTIAANRFRESAVAMFILTMRACARKGRLQLKGNGAVQKD